VTGVNFIEKCRVAEKDGDRSRSCEFAAAISRKKREERTSSEDEKQRAEERQTNLRAGEIAEGAAQ